MRFTTKIIVVHVMLVTAASVISAAMLLSLRSGRAAHQEIALSYEQTLAVQTIARMADDYSEQLAELFVLGPDEAEVVAARDVLLSAIGVMERQVREEIALLETQNDAAEIAEERQELDRMAALRSTVERIEAARVRMLAALRAGREQEAADIFASTIESGLDTLLDRLTADAVARERREVVQALADTDDAASQLRVVALTLAGGAFAAAAALSVFLHRSVLRPVERLAAGAEAVTAGDLSHRVPARRRDELGDLARAFNRMTAEIEDQRSALNAANEGLEREVVSRTAELRDAVGELEAQSEARSRFLADISHELRTPLTVIRGKAEVALHDPRTDAEGARAALERIATKAAQMGRLVDDLLFLARSEAGTIPMRRAPVVLQEVLADVLMDSRDLSERKGIQFVTGQPDEPVIVAGDGDRLRQAVLIPLDNAVQTAPRGSMIRVTLRRSGDIARIVVEDEGAGFDPELLGRAPRRFQHGRAGGTGLGLSIARWIMEGHGGALRLGNGPDGGAVVSLELPAGGAA